MTIEQPEPGAGDAVVYMRNNRFEPEVVTVKQGNAVFWYNEDETPHNVRMIGVIDSPYLVKDGGPYWHTFEEYPGEYEYYCEIHQSMRGRVIVTR